MASKLQKFECAVQQLYTGISLVEASAGTGKTYAIAMLVLRFVAEKNISVDKILVVTFTLAATEELRGRIRAKLVEGRDGLLGKLEEPDPTMLQWLEKIDASGKKEQAVKQLTLALAEIDLLPVFTIHGFCQRMLVEQALESGQLFDSELLADVNRIRLEVVEDYWRKHLYGLDTLSCSYLLSQFVSPEQLWLSVSKAPGADCIIPDCLPFDQTHQQFLACYSTLCLWWQEHGAGLVERMRTAANEGKFKGKLNAEFEQLVSVFDAFFAAGESVYVAELEYLFPEKLMEALNGNKFRKASKDDFIEELQLPSSMSDFVFAAQALARSFRLQLARSIGFELESRLAKNGRMSFDDLILRLARALDGESGKALRGLVDERFKVALIDEFQDTDAKQWKIFYNFFGMGKHSLYLIGDPKQAIYKFRGADIFSYFSAKSTAQHHLTLTENYRSHPYLVEEVNALFTAYDEPFLFDKSKMDYQPVTAAKSEDTHFLEQYGQREPSIVYGVLQECDSKTGSWTKGEADSCFLEFMAAEIARLLQPQNKVTLVKSDGGRPLLPKDIAILVRDRHQAERCRQILAENGYPVVMASKISVYDTQECRELYLLLQAVAAPGNLRKMKAALSVNWFDLSGDMLEAVFTDDEQIDSWTFRFMQYHQLWQERGFLAMINTLLQKEELLIRIGSEPFSERRMTNILHLCELMQQVESDERYTASQMLQHLSDTMKNPASQDAAELRLESDDDAIRIVTMHGSKGLEYPVVFCPYLWDGKQRINNKQKQVVFYDQQKEKLVLDLGSDEFENHCQLAQREELAEDIRLLYVTLTRAAAKLYVFWGDIRSNGFDVFGSALGHILFNRQRVCKEEQDKVFEARKKQGRVDVVLLTLAGNAITAYRKTGEAVTLEAASGGNASLQTDWQVSSFSALSALSEEEQLPLPVVVEKADEEILVTDLPAGAGFGNVVHDTLEYNDFQAIADGRLAEKALQYSCSRYGVKAETKSLQQLLTNVVQSPLFAAQPTVTLGDLDQKKMLKEMEFYFSLDKIDTLQLNTLLAEDPTVSNLSHRHLQGYLTGFVDLVFEHEDRYYIVDYKTNNLGDYMHNYQQQSLIHAMAAHNYGLQYWIYTAVLHRFLQKSIPGYSYENQFGGVLYLFVRGMHPEKPASGVFSTLPDRDKLEALLSILERSR